jgi:hypothetical protein
MTARRIAILCLLLTGLGVMTAEAARSRRFVARLNLELIGPPVSPSRCAPPLVLVELEGEGRVNRLGAVTAEASHCIVDDPADEGVSEGLLTITAGDGALELTYSGTDVDGDLSGVFIITGGSGELAGATGEGTFSGIAVPEENRGFVLLRGRLTVP